MIHYERHHPAWGKQPEVFLLVTLARGLDQQTGEAVCFAFGTDITAQKRTEAALVQGRSSGGPAPRPPDAW